MLCCLGLMGVILFSVGCEVDNYMDPSKTGYFEFAPTTIPVLERLDVVEVEELPFGEITTAFPPLTACPTLSMGISTSVT